MILLVMGVTGSGKSTVGRLLAERLGWDFLEADDFHSGANKEKMRRGIPLTDADRMPWLRAIHSRLLREDAAGKNVVLACSALKEDYRHALEDGLPVGVVFLSGSRELIANRIRERHGHFAGESILLDQFANLEEPRDAIVEDVSPPPDVIAQRILTRMRTAGMLSEAPAPASGQSVSKDLAAGSAPSLRSESKTLAEDRVESSNQPGKALLSKLRWRLLPFLFLLYVVAFLDRINVGFAAVPLKEQFGFSDRVYGLGAGIFFVGYFLFQVPSNMVLERVGARRWIALLMILWGLVSASMLFTHSPTSFYTLRFLLGATEAGFYPGVIYYFRSWFPPSARAGVVALFTTAGPVSGILGGPISGALLDWNHRGGLAGWQWMFLIEAIPAVVLGAIAYFYLTDSPERARWLVPEEKERLRDSLLRAEKKSAESAAVAPSQTWLAVPGLWGFALVYFGLNTCTYGVSLWLPSALKSLAGLPNLLLGFLSALPYLVAVIVMILVGIHSDRTSERRWHIALSALVGAVALITAGYSHAVPLTLAAFGIALASSYSMVGPFWALASGSLTGTAAARGIAVINSVGNLGSGFGPYWIGYLRHVTGTFRAGLFSVAFMLAVAGLLVLLLQRPSRAASQILSIQEQPTPPRSS